MHCYYSMDYDRVLLQLEGICVLFLLHLDIILNQRILLFHPQSPVPSFLMGLPSFLVILRAGSWLKCTPVLRELNINLNYVIRILLSYYPLSMQAFRQISK